MVDKITCLTLAQEITLAEWRETYLAHGLSCAPADRPRAEAAFARAYAAIGRKPVPVIWVDSPLSASVLIHVLTKTPKGKKSPDLHDALADRLVDYLRYDLLEILRAYTSESLRLTLQTSLIEDLGKTLRTALRTSVAGSLWDSLRKNMRTGLSEDQRSLLSDNASARLSMTLLNYLQASLSESLQIHLASVLKDSLSDNAEDSLEGSFGSDLRSSLWNSLSDKLSNTSSNKVLDDLTDSLRNALSQILSETLENTLWASIWDGQKDDLRSFLKHDLYDKLQHDLWDSLSDSSSDALGESLGGYLQDIVQANLFANLWQNLGRVASDSLEDTLPTAIEDSFGDDLRTSLLNTIITGIAKELLIRLFGSLSDSLEENLADTLWSTLHDSLNGAVDSSLERTLRKGLHESLLRAVQNCLRASMQADLAEKLGLILSDRLRFVLDLCMQDALKTGKITPTHTYWWGQQDLYWIAFYRFCSEVLGVQYTPEAADRLDIMHEIGLSCMWWYPRDGVVIACERPERVHMTPESRLHCIDGPAVKFRDGWSIYAVNNVRVPGWIIETPQKITIASIDAEPNDEIRRVMIDRYGWYRFLHDSRATFVDHDEARGTLYRRAMPHSDPIMMLVVTNRTPEPDGSFKRYVRPVHHELRPLPDLIEDPNGTLGEPQALTAHNAVASTFGLRGEQYFPEVET